MGTHVNCGGIFVFEFKKTNAESLQYRLRCDKCGHLIDLGSTAELKPKDAGQVTGLEVNV